MATLVWDAMEQGYRCPECGALYSDDEVGRCFGYAETHVAEDFFESYCMDCGVLWTEADLTGKDD